MNNNLQKLLSTYNDNRSAYDPNETDTRSGLIDPLLELLGWDVTDPRQVRREQSVDTSAGKKRTDYILYDDRGRPVVVIEAKAPKVNIEHDNDAVFQVLRYGWNLETVPVGILTNFTNWEVYKTSTRPDKQNTQRFRVPELCFSSEEYIEQWDKINSYFSRDAVLRGRLRAYATTAKLSLPPDEAFLKDLERYRELIAKALVGNDALRHNWDLSEYSQRVLDRLLLIRILEDRGYGERGGWLHRIAQANDPGQQLSDHVNRLEPTFNSRFFKWHEVDSLDLDPEKLRKVVKELADPDSVYNFAAMPVEIIGKAYEKFLGSTVRITPARRVKIEAKPEVRKAGGVYYTPSYIVDYIVENTLGPLFADKSETTVAKYKVLDPACGSGSFLIGAARWLDGWYQQKYGRKLSYDERRTIVLRHLHGVDIDQNAVEVTQLSLCLWLLEEAPHQMEMAHEALLPDLSANIKCGNSLIGSDFYTQDQGDLFADDEVRHRVNAFDWDGPNGFAEIMKKKSRNLWFVTFVTHNSRVSERMVVYGVKRDDPVVFTPDDQLTIAKHIAEVCKNSNIPVVTWNVLPDHVHMLIAARNEKELNEYVRKIKGSSAKVFAEARGWTKGQHVWAQKFNRKAVRDEEALGNIYTYIKNNHLKHATAESSKGLKPLVSTPCADDPLDKGRPPIEESSKGLKPLVSTPCADGPLDKGLQPLAELERFRSRIEPYLDSAIVSVEEATQTQGGFDAVIGNPPYVRQELLGGQKEYFSSHYEAYVATADLYVLFIEKALRLLGDKGRFSYIVSNKWMRARYGEKLRKYVKQYQIEQLVDFGELPVFKEAATFPLVIVISKEKAKRKPLYAPIKRLDFSSLSAEVKDIAYELEAGTMSESGFTLVRSEQQAIIEKMQKVGIPLSSYASNSIRRGILTGFNEAFIIDEAKKNELIAEDPKSAEIIKSFVVGNDVRSYRINYDGKYLILTKIGIAIKEYPAIFNHLKQYESQLKKRWDKGNHWWELRACAYYADFEKPKIVWPEIAKESRFTLDEQPYHTNKTIFMIALDDKYLLGLLNSKLVWLFLMCTCSCLGDVNKGGRLLLQRIYTQTIPIRTIDPNNPDDVARHDEIVLLVERMLDLHKKLPTTTGNDKTQYEQLIAATDKRIDQLVYQLYDLTDEEIAIVEEATRG